MSCTDTSCGCTCPDCIWARRNRKDPKADARHCHVHRNRCHWKGCAG